MPPRKRKTGKDLEPNLYPNRDRRSGRIYYQFRDPRTGKFHGMGSDKVRANEEARDLNAIIGAQIREARLAAIVARDTDKPTFSQWCTRYLEGLPERKLKPTTVRMRTNCVEHWRRKLGQRPMMDITTKDIADVLDEYVAAEKHRMAGAMRSVAIDVWTAAIERGWAATNVARVTRPRHAAVNRGRLTLEQLQAILAAAESLDPWVANSILLGVVTGQRRQDIGPMRFRRGADWEGLFADHLAGKHGPHPYPHVHEGQLWVVQQKVRGGGVGSLVKIPLELRLEALNVTLGDVVGRCRDSVASPYLIHHTKARTMSKPGDPVHLETITKGFARARNMTGLTWPRKPATYYELRSLAERLYEAQGNVNTQSLLGHKNKRTTAIYHDSRGADWIEVKA